MVCKIIDRHIQNFTTPDYLSATYRDSRAVPDTFAIMSVPSLQSLPRDILTMLPDYMHNIEDYINLSLTRRILRSCMTTTMPDNILRLAVAQSKIFFRPSPLFLLIARAKELGNWARASDANEHEFASKCKRGSEGLLELASKHCGLTLERIRELHLSLTSSTDVWEHSGRQQKTSGKAASVMRTRLLQTPQIRSFTCRSMENSSPQT
jgi:hypothetical protein